MKSEYVLSLIRAFVRCDRTHFLDVARQVAAGNKSLNNGQFSRAIEELIYKVPAEGLTQLPRGGSGQDSVSVRPIEHKLSDLILSSTVASGIAQVLEEQQFVDDLESNGCKACNKILFDGPPGTGKTSAAGAIADSLRLPFVVAKQHELIDSHMGESDRALVRLFDFASSNKAVILLDEFDAIGTSRMEAKAGAEKAMNNIVTTVLQALDRHRGPSIIIMATNLPRSIDEAILRRFDHTITFDLPSEERRLQLIKRTLGDDDGPFTGSHAVIVRDCLREKKRRLLSQFKSRDSR